MNADQLFYGTIMISTILAVINVWNYKSYKALSIKNELLIMENELLHQKVKDCEQRGLNGIHECPHD